MQVNFKIYTPLLSYRGDHEEKYIQKLAIKAKSDEAPAKVDKVEDEKAARVRFEININIYFISFGLTIRTAYEYISNSILIRTIYLKLPFGHFLVCGEPTILRLIKVLNNFLDFILFELLVSHICLIFPLEFKPTLFKLFMMP